MTSSFREQRTHSLIFDQELPTYPLLHIAKPLPNIALE